jgi:DMSO reductase anchor subunit
MMKAVHIGTVGVRFVESRRQTIWGWPAIINFTFGSAGAALYFVSSFLELFRGTVSGSTAYLIPQMMGVGFVSLGFFTLAFEAGRPFKARFLLGNLRGSWMSREALLAVIFVPVGLLLSSFNNPLLLCLGAATALLFLVCQALILYHARGVPAWNVRGFPVIFVCSAVTAAAGLLQVLPLQSGFATPPREILTMAVILPIIDIAAWLSYLHQLREDGFRQSNVAPLRTGLEVVLIVGPFRLLPVLLAASAFAVPTGYLSPRYLLMVGGGMLFAGSLVQKFAIIRIHGYLRRIGLRFPATSPSAWGTASFR